MTRLLSALCSAALALAITVAHAASQATFPNADAAVSALIDALQKNDQRQLQAVLGPGSEALINSGDPNADTGGRERFLANYAAQHKLVPAGPGRMVLDVGTDNWPLPMPVVQSNGSWHFDSRAGARELVNRRIGRNEVAAIRVSLTYVDAQRDFFARSKQNGGTGEYAQRLVSTPGKHDGLYWPATAGVPESPLAGLIAQAIDEGYPGEIVSGRPIPYQGYYFRILKGQGADAPDGAKSYMARGKMTGGFALVAWPASFGSSGIMTFVVNQDGVVFQKDLGDQTPALAAAMKRFDPDISWARVDVTGG